MATTVQQTILFVGSNKRDPWFHFNKRSTTYPQQQIVYSIGKVRPSTTHLLKFTLPHEGENHTSRKEKDLEGRYKRNWNWLTGNLRRWQSERDRGWESGLIKIHLKWRASMPSLALGIRTVRLCWVMHHDGNRMLRVVLRMLRWRRLLKVLHALHHVCLRDDRVHQWELGVTL